MNHGRSLLASAAVLTVLALLVHFTLGWAALLAPWRALRPWELLPAGALILLTYVLRSLRQSAYFPTAMRGHFWLSTRLMLWHNFYNNFLPMRAGELSFPMLCKRYFAIPLTEATAALLWFRVLDLLAIALIGVLASLSRLPWLAPLALLLAIAPWLLPYPLRWLSSHVQRGQGRLAVFTTRLLTALPNGHGQVLSSWWWTLVNWGVKLLVFAWLLRMFTPMPFAVAMAGAIGGDLTSVLPIHSVAGLGTYEAGVAAAVAPFGIAAARAVPAAFNLHLVILASTVLGVMLMALLPLGRAIKDSEHESA